MFRNQATTHNYKDTVKCYRGLKTVAVNSSLCYVMYCGDYNLTESLFSCSCVLGGAL